MMAKKTVNIFVFVFLFSLGLSAQADFTGDYVLNENLINPAMAGKNHFATFNLSIDRSWLVPNAPARESFWFSTRYEKMGFATALLSQQQGIEINVGMQLTYFYLLTLEPNDRYVSLGISGYWMQDYWDTRNLQTVDPDPAIIADPFMKFYPQVAIGAMYFDRYLSVGGSLQRVLPTSGTYEMNGIGKALPPYFSLHATYDFKHPYRVYMFRYFGAVYGDFNELSIDGGVYYYPVGSIKIGLVGKVKYNLGNAPIAGLSVVYGMRLYDKFYFVLQSTYNFSSYLPAPVRFENGISLRYDISKALSRLPRQW